MPNSPGRYSRIFEQLAHLLGQTDHLIARMATMNALLYSKLDGVSWVGFYLLSDSRRLLVGPYQGPLACQELDYPNGVCWAGILRNESVFVPDVHAFPGHIACDARSKSEIVIPVRDRDGVLTGVLDLDSNKADWFRETDARQLERFVTLLNI